MMSTAKKDKTKTSIFDVAIVGAGLAGSLSAHLLSKSGYKVCVIEKSRGSGGRASSKKITDEINCDLGAPFIYAHKTESKDLLEELVEANVAAPWKQLSKKGTQAFVGIPKMSSITRHWLQKSTFITQTRIHHIEKIHPEGGPSVWLLRNDQYQEVACAQKIIITAPAPQTAMILATHADLAVPLLRANQANSSYQSQWAMWLETKRSNLNAVIDLNDSPIARLIRDNDKPMRGDEDVERWVIQANPEWTNTHLDVDKNEITQKLLQAFSEYTEQRVLQHGEPHRWFLSRFKENKGNEPYVWSSEHNIGLAGDWLCQGDAEGALLSALSLINAIKENR